jgi:hypothetical protein
MRGWLGEEPEFKLLAFILLLPMVGLNLFLVFAGIAAGMVEVPIAGGIGLVVLLLLLNAARGSPRAVGVWFLVISVAVGVVGLRLNYWSALWLLIYLAPVPGAVVLMYAGMAERHLLGPPAPLTRRPPR